METKTIIKKILKRLGYRIAKSQKKTDAPYSVIKLENRRFTYLDQLKDTVSFIPSMLSPERGKFLYALCYMQRLQGDVVEVGSWQGYSTAFLATAVHDSENGSFYAIDHFKGNIGKEHRYVMNRKDLSDLRENFENNMRKIGLWDCINLLDMPNNLAVKKLEGKRIRFLFIDGDHTKQGVQTDIDLFFPLLMPGSIVVFDDFSDSFPGLVEVVDNLLGTNEFERVFSYKNTLVIMI